MHVNLIFEEEQRSASPVSPWLMVRLMAAVVVVLGILQVVTFTTKYHGLQGAAQDANDDWKRTEPKYKAALQLRGELGASEATLKELQGWRDSRISWGDQLDQLRLVVPEVVQLTDLRVSQNILSLPNNITARVFELRISGRTGGAGAEENLNRFLDGFKQPAFKPVVESASLPPGAFRADPDNKMDRVFLIVCKYLPRPIE